MACMMVPSLEYIPHVQLCAFWCLEIRIVKPMHWVHPIYFCLLCSAALGELDLGYTTDLQSKVVVRVAPLRPWILPSTFAVLHHWIPATPLHLRTIWGACTCVRVLDVLHYIIIIQLHVVTIWLYCPQLMHIARPISVVKRCRNGGSSLSLRGGGGVCTVHQCRRTYPRRFQCVCIKGPSAHHTDFVVCMLASIHNIHIHPHDDESPRLLNTRACDRTSSCPHAIAFIIGWMLESRPLRACCIRCCIDGVLVVQN